MFEIVESGAKISKSQYKKRLPELRFELLQAQFALQKAGIPLLIILSGVEGAGKGEVVNRLNSWLDTRYIETNVFRVESDEQKRRPFYWRYWRKLPSKKQVGIFIGSWYRSSILKRVQDGIKDAEYYSELHRILIHEQMLAKDGMLIAKFWFHISKKEQKKRLRVLEKNERTQWRVTEEDWKHHDQYDDYKTASERAIRKTDTADVPWHVLDASQDRYRDLAVMEILLQKMNMALKYNGGENESSAGKNIQSQSALKPKNILDRIDLTQAIEQDVYSSEFDELKLEIDYLAWQCYRNGISSVFVFEGWDAAGKGGVIRRLIQAMDAKLYRVIQIAAPTDEEKEHHYLWRFWRHIPRDGKITIYDRSWYGRVLVERVEGFATEAEWGRAYSEINEFEQQLTEHGTIVQKFWLHISSDEQLRRFKEREITDYKKHKLTEDDWRNRDKHELYKDAVHDMVAKTGTEYAPWNIIAADDKNHARISVLRIIRDKLEEALKSA